MKTINKIPIYILLIILTSTITVSAAYVIGDDYGEWGIKLEVSPPPGPVSYEVNSSGTWGIELKLEWYETVWYDNWWTMENTPELTPPSSFAATAINASKINLTFNKIAGTDRTHIQRREGSYPTSPTVGTTVYNDTGTKHSDTGLDNGTYYFYSAWAYNETYNEYSSTYSTAYSLTAPGPVTGIYQIDNLSRSITLGWTKGHNASNTLIRYNTSTYPTNTGEGIGEYIGIDSTHEITGLEPSTTYYFSFWGWNLMASDNYTTFMANTTAFGDMTIWVYKETEPEIAITNYTVFIKNQDGTQTYENTSVNNPHNINLSHLPLGEDVAIQISKEGYHTRIQYMDLDVNYSYNVTFYLAPSSDGGGNPDEPDYIPPEGEESVQKIETRSVDNYTQDMWIYLTYRAYEITSVYVFNNSVKVWETAPSNKYTVNYANGTILLNETVLDKNSTTVRIDYYAFSDEKYARHYIVLIKTVDGKTIEEAKVTIQRYINTTEEFENIYIIYTDGYGTVGVDLMPDTLYQIILEKDDYETAIYNLLPIPIVFVEDRYHTFIMTPEGIIPVWVETVQTNITYTIEPKGSRHTSTFTFYYNITSSDSKLEWYRMLVYYYNDTTDIYFLLSNQNQSVPSGGSLSYTIPDVKGKYVFELYYKKEGYAEYEISETGSLIQFYVEIQEGLEEFPDYAWMIIIIFVMLFVMGICIKFFATGITTGYIGLAIMGFMLLMKDVEIQLGGATDSTISGWAIFGITFLIYTVGVFLWSRI